MALFPDPPVAPLEVTPGLMSGPADFAESVAGVPTTMLLRLAKLGTDCTAPGGADPTILLSADTGNLVAVTKDPNSVSIRNGPPDTGVRVAFATYLAETADVFLVRVVVTVPGSHWRIAVKNNDAVPRRFVWAVGDSDQATRQPWIQLPSELRFEAQTGQSIEKSVVVANRGTGPLTISPGGLPAGSPFVLGADLPSAIGPNSCAALPIKFTAPSAAGSVQSTYQAVSNDSTSATTPEHNGRITLSATVISPPVVDPGHEPKPESDFGRCMVCTFCPRYMVPAFGPRGRCARPDCRHPQIRHRPPE